MLVTMSTSLVEVRSYRRRGPHLADARAATRDILRLWHVQGETVDDVTLVVSELIGNAVQHTVGPVVILTLTLSETMVMVEVVDSSLNVPVASIA